MSEKDDEFNELIGKLRYDIDTALRLKCLMIAVEYGSYDNEYKPIFYAQQFFNFVKGTDNE